MSYVPDHYELHHKIKFAIRELIAAYEFPPAPTGGACVCGNPTSSNGWAIYEPGYFRTTVVGQEQDGVWIATADGWDDLSETGVQEFLTCTDCTRLFKLPEVLEWA